VGIFDEQRYLCLVGTIGHRLVSADCHYLAISIFYGIGKSPVAVDVSQEGQVPPGGLADVGEKAHPY
jgi:hypothetical protein